LADKQQFSLATIKLLADLTDDQFAKLDKACAWKRYVAHEQIIDRDSETRDVFFIVKGRVRISNYSLSGREITLDDLSEGAHFGELSAIDHHPRSASVVALEDCHLALLSPDRFAELCMENPHIAFRVMQSLTQIVRSSNERIMDLSTVAANNRVHAEVLRQAREHMVDDEKAEITPIPVHGDIASRVSTTRETVARVMNDLARKGLVERQKDTMVVLDVESLQDMVEEVKGE
jgi:CRP/FNR family transcriptional regulator, cyclic AMP receptor protein